MFNADPDSAFPNSEFLRPVENSQEILRDTAGRADLRAATKLPLRYSAQQLPLSPTLERPARMAPEGQGPSEALMWL
jgi:hypothetical protein